MEPSFIDSNLENLNSDKSSFLFLPYKSRFHSPTFKITTPQVMIRKRNLTPNNDLIVQKLPEIFINNFSYPGSIDESNPSSSRLSRDSRAHKQMQAQRIKSEVHFIQEKVARDKIKQFIQQHENNMKNRAQAQKLEIQEKLQETRHQLIKAKRVI